MADLSADFTIPNAFGLLSADFRHDLTSYRAALAFLSDLASGTEEAEALRLNDGNPALLRSWQGSEKFRRVYAKCRVAGEAERAAVRRAESAAKATDEAEQGNPSGQVFVPLSEAPTQRSVFSNQPPRGSWGEP